MNSYTIATEKIKASISAQDVGEAIGLEIRRGRCKCPIHRGDDFNCVLYKGDRGYYCHVCKSGGDVIKFAQEYYKTPFKETISWFNDTFRLGLDLESRMTQDERRRAENALQMRKNAIAFKQWKERMRFDLALTADQIVEKLEEQRDLFTPKTPDEKWDPRFAEAVRLLPYARRFAEDCMAECIKEKEE